jgi:pyruvate/2-oxoglutarate/acetoin dehydrogenase E1 component
MNDAGAPTRPMGMAEALRDAMRIAMRTDPTVFLLGEDIGVSGGFGGGFTVTLGLAEEFGRERVIDTPISEGAIVGAAVGAAMAGSRPVAEMQYGDFVFCAMDQVVNQAAKMRYMSNGSVRVPMVLRLPVGASQRGAQHGQSSEAWFMHTPGLKVASCDPLGGEGKADRGDPGRQPGHLPGAQAPLRRQGNTQGNRANLARH